MATKDSKKTTKDTKENDKHTEEVTELLAHNRETWLNNAIIHLRPLFTDNYSLPPQNLIKVSCGPCGGINTIGICYSTACSEKKYSEIFISPKINDSIQVLGILTHELCHVSVGTDKKHKAPFKRCMQSVGLTGNPTTTIPGETLIPILQNIKEKIGDYPHAKLIPTTIKKDTTRLIKCDCEICGYTVRITRKWLKVAYPQCPIDQINLVSDWTPEN